LVLFATVLPEPPSVDFLAHLDRELSGLLDAYLEAVPECPVHPDTPLRLWVLDLAWLRAKSAVDSLLMIDGTAFTTDSLLWSRFVSGTLDLFEVFSGIQEVYHETDVPGDSMCIKLEDMLISADSTWRHYETVLLDSISKEEHDD